MNQSDLQTAAEFVLPSTVVSKIDLAHLVHELERVDNELTTAAVRAKTGITSPTDLQLSGQLTDFLNQNELAPTTSHDRSELIKQLRQLADQVPVIHMTFAVPADPDSLAQLVQWLRLSVHPQAVIEVGLQPALVAGVYLRTTNKVYDLSMRSALQRGHQVLVKELELLNAGR